MLIQNNSKIDATDSKGWTALMQAAYYGHVKVVKTLLQAGADLDIKDVNDNTALILAQKKRHTEIVKLLLDAKDKLHEKERRSDIAQTPAFKKIDAEFNKDYQNSINNLNKLYQDKVGETYFRIFSVINNKTQSKMVQNVIDVLKSEKNESTMADSIINEHILNQSRHDTSYWFTRGVKQMFG